MIYGKDCLSAASVVTTAVITILEKSTWKHRAWDYSTLRANTSKPGRVFFLAEKMGNQHAAIYKFLLSEGMDEKETAKALKLAQAML